MTGCSDDLQRYFVALVLQDDRWAACYRRNPGKNNLSRRVASAVVMDARGGQEGESFRVGA